MVDRATLDQMLANLRRYLAVLRGLAAVPREAFLTNPDKIGNAKYHLVIAIECCIEHGLLDDRDGETLRAMARFRNRLVHLYWDVDDARVHDYLQEGLGDLARFGDAIARREW